MWLYGPLVGGDGDERLVGKGVKTGSKMPDIRFGLLWIMDVRRQWI